MDYRVRLDNLRRALAERGVVGAVLAPSNNMRYVSGWAEPGGERFIGLFVPASGEPVYVVPAMNEAQVRANPAGYGDVRPWDDGAGWADTAGGVLSTGNWSAGPIAVDDEMDAVHLLGMQALASGARWVPAGPIMAGLREVKSPDELALMDRSGAIADEVYTEVVGKLAEGMSELDVCTLVDSGFRKRNAVTAFSLICFGANTALPHHLSDGTRLRHGDVVIMDIGCHYRGYASDITRTVAFGTPDPLASEVYRIVREAHSAALAAARPGTPCEEVDAAARRVIGNAGYGDRFLHRTGHGIGLSVHEDPYIVRGNTKQLQPGMCFTDEPGIYLDGRFGVRIENSVTVTENGSRYLNQTPSHELKVVV